MHRMKSLLSFGLIAMVIMIVGLLAINVPATYAIGEQEAAHAKLQAGEKEALAAVDLVRLKSYNTMIWLVDQHGYDIFAWRGRQETANVYTKSEDSLLITYHDGQTTTIPLKKIRRLHTFERKPSVGVVKRKYLQDRPAIARKSLCIHALNEMAANW